MAHLLYSRITLSLCKKDKYLTKLYLPTLPKVFLLLMLNHTPGIGCNNGLCLWPANLLIYLHIFVPVILVILVGLLISLNMNSWDPHIICIHSFIPPSLCIQHPASCLSARIHIFIHLLSCLFFCLSVRTELICNNMLTTISAEHNIKRECEHERASRDRGKVGVCSNNTALY